MESFDCQRCGACCFNPSANREDGYVAYVEVEPRDRLHKRRDLLKRHTVEIDGVVHMRVASDHRCSALRGGLGGRVRCDIYSVRPSPCRRVQPGDDLCLRYRQLLQGKAG